MPQPKERIQLAPNDEKLLEKRGYTIGEPLNCGSFACVCKATFNGVPVAVKVIDLEKTSDGYRLRFLPREIYTMAKLKHKHLIDVLNIFVVGNRVIVFMELAEGGDFHDLLRKTKGLPEDQVRYFYLQFGDALRYMHSVGFAHRDIKCQNILLNKEHTLSKMTDFGFCRSCFQKDSNQQVLSATYCGSLPYMAPEVLQSKPYNPLVSDVWSMGIVLYMLVYNKFPFSDKDKLKLRNSQLDRNYIHLKQRQLSKHCKDLIDLHLNPDPEKRLNMVEVLDHEWFGPKSKAKNRNKDKEKDKTKDKIKHKDKTKIKDTDNVKVVEKEEIKESINMEKEIVKDKETIEKLSKEQNYEKNLELSDEKTQEFNIEKTQKISSEKNVEIEVKKVQESIEVENSQKKEQSAERTQKIDIEKVQCLGAEKNEEIEVKKIQESVTVKTEISNNEKTDSKTKDNIDKDFQILELEKKEDKSGENLCKEQI